MQTVLTIHLCTHTFVLTIVYCEYMAKGERLQVRCTKEELLAWQKVAKAYDTSVSDLARSVLNAYVEKEKLNENPS